MNGIKPLTCLPQETKERYETISQYPLNITLLTPSDLNAADLLLLHDGDDYNFTDGVKVGENKAFVVRDEEIPVSDWQIKILDTQKEVDKMWLVVRYILK